MKTERINNTEINVYDAPIRGYHWMLTRKPGTGTYALFAGQTDDDPDEEMIIEEASDDVLRARIDGFADLQAAQIAFRVITDQLNQQQL